MHHAPAPAAPRGRWRARVDDGGVSALPPHLLQRFARVVYLGTAVALLVWVVREQTDRLHVRRLVGGCIPLVLNAALLGLTVTRIRGRLPPSPFFTPTLLLVALHALCGLSGGLSLAAYGSFARAVEGIGPLPVRLSLFATFGGLPLAVLLLVTARRVAPYVGTCVGTLAWLLVAVSY